MRASKILIGATLGALSIVAMGTFVAATVSAASILMMGTVALVPHDPTPIVSAGSPHTEVAYGAAPFRIVDSSSRTIAAAARGATRVR
jgi:hypothetical protein